ncbi:MAG: hypothetical protein IJC86_02185 [Clostridia bacterium]|nr:hypothetical protein [Clostridia bacterium]
MKANSRRRVLISSLAMLLVALVALSTATFAWFTASTSATASGVNVKTVQASELKVASSAYSFTDTLNYGYTNQAFKPASSSNGTAWYTAEAATKGAFTAKDSKFDSITLSPTDNYVFDEELNIRNYGAAKVEDVTITFSIAETATTENQNYVRVALVPMTAHNGTFTATNFQSSDYIFDKDGVAYNAVDSATTAAVSITPGTDCTVEVGDLAGYDGETYAEANYKLFIWFEGQDAQCFDSNAGNALPSISFAISGNTVQ